MTVEWFRYRNENYYKLEDGSVLGYDDYQKVLTERNLQARNDAFNNYDPDWPQKAAARRAAQDAQLYKSPVNGQIVSPEQFYREHSVLQRQASDAYVARQAQNLYPLDTPMPSGVTVDMIPQVAPDGAIVHIPQSVPAGALSRVPQQATRNPRSGVGAWNQAAAMGATATQAATAVATQAIDDIAAKATGTVTQQAIKRGVSAFPLVGAGIGGGIIAVNEYVNGSTPLEVAGAGLGAAAGGVLGQIGGAIAGIPGGPIGIAAGEIGGGIAGNEAGRRAGKSLGRATSKLPAPVKSAIGNTAGAALGGGGLGAAAAMAGAAAKALGNFFNPPKPIDDGHITGGGTIPVEGTPVEGGQVAGAIYSVSRSGGTFYNPNTGETTPGEESVFGTLIGPVSVQVVVTYESGRYSKDAYFSGQAGTSTQLTLEDNWTTGDPRVRGVQYSLVRVDGGTDPPPPNPSYTKRPEPAPRGRGGSPFANPPAPQPWLLPSPSFSPGGISPAAPGRPAPARPAGAPAAAAPPAGSMPTGSPFNPIRPESPADGPASPPTATKGNTPASTNPRPTGRSGSGSSSSSSSGGGVATGTTVLPSGTAVTVNEDGSYEVSVPTELPEGTTVTLPDGTQYSNPSTGGKGQLTQQTSDSGWVYPDGTPVPDDIINEYRKNGTLDKIGSSTKTQTTAKTGDDPFVLPQIPLWIAPALVVPAVPQNGLKNVPVNTTELKEKIDQGSGKTPPPTDTPTDNPCRCNAPIIDRLDKLDQRLGNVIVGPTFVNSPQVVDSSLREDIEELKRRVGTKDFPVNVPDQIAKGTPLQKNLDSLAELHLWQVEQLDGVVGRWPMQVPVPGISQALAVPNLSEAIAEMVGMMISQQVTAAQILNTSSRTLAQAGSATQQAALANQIAKGNAEFLGYESKPTAVDMPLTYTPGKEPGEGLLEESTAKIKGWSNTDNTDLKQILSDLLHAAQIIKAVYWRKLDAKGDFKDQIDEQIRGKSAFLDELGSRPSAQQQSDWEEYLKGVEVGFNQLSKDETPYGRTPEEGPKITDITPTSEED